jgi:hypothetical protein
MEVIVEFLQAAGLVFVLCVVGVCGWVVWNIKHALKRN